ncbi:MAG: M20/M25/M40 family metallo-hydrolase, partial [Acidimicrobiia bacterium]|nr:M20/M25/M40 family metallo-hydrolase [Acidimicrobiia bacterium]
MHDELRSRVSALFPRLQSTLEELIAIPSVSLDGFPPEEVRRSAERVAELLADVGVENTRLLEIDGAHPAVYGEIPPPEGMPTVLLYAHHDVQPPGPAEEWETGPFTPVVKENRLLGRGASDDKAGIIMHLGSILAHEGRPPVGIKLLIEGEEETGSDHLVDFLDAYSDQLKADVVVIADSGNWRVGIPALTTSLRGLVACIVEVRTLASPQHSGLFGGVVPDAITAFSRLVATLHNDDGEVAIEGLVGREEPGPDLSEDEVRELSGAVDGLELMGSGSFTSRMWTKPAVAVLAMDVPPISQAINQVIPVVRSKISMRIAPGQKPDEAMEALTRHLEENAPWGVEVSVTPVDTGEAFSLTTEGIAFDAWRTALTEAFDHEVVEMGVGGSIPFVSAFSERIPDAPILLTGAGDPTSSVHAPNESQDLADLQSAVLAEAIALQ